MAVLPEHATSAFDVMWAPPSAPQTAQSTFRTAHKLCRLAEAAHRPLSESALASARDSAASRSWILSSLGSEVLTQRGMLTVPDRLKDVVDRKVSAATTPAREDDSAFSSRIDVDHYDAYELLHPAYARQVSPWRKTSCVTATASQNGRMRWRSTSAPVPARRCSC